MADPSAASTVLSFEEARRVVENHAALIPHPETEWVGLLAARGRVLAQPVVADRDFPPFSRSTRDGYAVQSPDVAHPPVVLDVIGEVKAGETFARVPEIGSHQAASIMTGAPLPAGADAVVMMEYTTPREKSIAIERRVRAGENVVARGAEARQGSILVDRSTLLNESSIACAASVGSSELMVYKRPRVAVLATGDEIVHLDTIPGETQIRNSNSYSLAVQIANAGAEPVLLPIAPDEPRQLRSRMEEGLAFDLLLITGGVSLGRYDLVEEVLNQLQAQFFFTGAKIQPGRPVVFGKSRSQRAISTGWKYFFGLPGNPVSTMVTFELFVRPLLGALAGRSAQKLCFVHARLKSEVRVKPGLKRFLPAILAGEFENSSVELIPWQGSGDVAATARANCYVVIGADRDFIPADEFAPVLLR
jgi:molybdopterin molybdotransferase